MLSFLNSSVQDIPAQPLCSLETFVLVEESQCYCASATLSQKLGLRHAKIHVLTLLREMRV